jgi:two-component system, LytTR family, response regulator
MNRQEPLKALIVDDEPLGRDCVRIALAGVGEVEIVAECAEARQALAAIAELKPDLVFLDVQMPEMDGFEIIQRVGRDQMPIVIFITAHDEHALRAFDVHALDYVLKPFTDDRIREAVERARWLYDARNRSDQLPVISLRDSVSGDDKKPSARSISRVTVKDDGRAFFVAVRDIDYFEADGNYVKLHVRGNAHAIRATVRALSSQLDPRRFVRIHKSTIVNVERVKEVQPWFGGDYVAVLHDGTQLRVSRTFAGDLLQPFR